MLENAVGVYENREEDLDGEVYVRVTDCILRFSPFIYAECRLRLSSLMLFVLLCSFVRTRTCVC